MPSAVYSGPGYPANPPYTVVTVRPPAECIVGVNCPPACPPNCPPSDNPIDIGIAKIGEVNVNNPDGPYNFTIGVRNLAGPITTATPLTFTDVVPAGMTFTSVVGTNYTCLPLAPVSGGTTLTCTYTGTFPIAPNQILGSVAIVADGGNGPYENCAKLGQTDHDPSNDKACVTVQKDHGNFTVVKEVENTTQPHVSTVGLVYPVTVTCGGTVTNLNLVEGMPQTVGPIAYNTPCQVAEGTPPLPTGACPAGQLAWTMPTAYLPSDSVTIVSGINATIRVHNKLECAPSGGELGSLTVTKTVVIHAQGTLSTTGLSYPISVSCASGGSPAVVTNLSLTENIPQTVSNIALNSSCTVSETTPMPTPTGACAAVGAVPTWTLPPTFTPTSPVPVNGTNVSMTVQNTLECKPPDGGGNTDDIDVSLAKTGGTTPACPVPYYAFTLKVTNNHNAYGGPNPVTVTDTVPNGLKFDTATGTNWTCTPLPANAGTTITCTYTGTPLTTGQVLPAITIGVTAQDPAPFPPYTNCADVMTSFGHNDANLSNNHACVTVAKPSSCPQGVPPPPPTCSPPLVQVQGGACACPQGTELVDGQCVPPPPTCQPPMVPGAVKGECICGPGYKRHGKSCVKELVCGEHASPNRAGTECMCARGYMMKSGACVLRPREEKPKRRERERDGIAPGDVIRVLPGLLGPGGFGGGGSHGGGGGAGGGGGKKGP